MVHVQGYVATTGAFAYQHLMFTYYLLKLASVVAPRLPLPVGYWLAWMAANILYVIQPRVRQNVESNIRQVLGEKADAAKIRATARQVFITQARNYYDLFRLRKLTLEDIHAIVTVQGEEHLDRALRQGKGVILVTGHLGNLDIVAQVAVAYSYRVTIPVERVQPEKLFDLVTRARSHKGINLVPVGIEAVKAIRRALDNNELIAIAADRDVLKSGAKVNFFGKETTLPDAPAVLALRTGAPVLPARSLRYDRGRYGIEIRPPIVLQSSGNLKDDITANTQRITDALESFISEHPEQWVVFEPVWNMQEEKT